MEGWGQDPAPLCQENRCPLPCCLRLSPARWGDRVGAGYPLEKRLCPWGRETRGLPSGKEASQMYKANPRELALP